MRVPRSLRFGPSGIRRWVPGGKERGHGRGQVGFRAVAGEGGEGGRVRGTLERVAHMDQREHPRFSIGQASSLRGRPGAAVSFSDWDDDASLKAWKTSAGFRERFEPVRELCDVFVGGDHEVAAAVL
jgi:hypothetical protein